MKHFIIAKNDANQRLDRFITKAVPLLPKSLLYKYIRTKRIKLNGKRCDISYTLMVGDKLELYINDEFFDSDKNIDFLQTKSTIDIIYEDKNILLVNKPCGLVVHEDNENAKDTLINRVKYYLYIKGEFDYQSENSFVPSLCNRIDRNTIGIVIVAKNADALRLINEKIKANELSKKYLCVVSGVMPKNYDTLIHYHLKNDKTATVTVFDKPRPYTKTMISYYKVLEVAKDKSLVEVTLKTGRTHQIRAQFAHIGHPILGDTKYGDKAVNQQYNYKHQLLCAYKLCFNFSDENLLSYLNLKEFTVNNIWFYDEFMQNL